VSDEGREDTNDPEAAQAASPFTAGEGTAGAMPTAFDPHAIESRWYAFWQDKGYFTPTIEPGKKPFVIVIPPPNVTGSLHMGHALNNTIQDVLVRRSRMMGRPTLWLPGTDHAGIATQNKVEQKLADEGLTRHDVGREEFIRRVWEWKDEHGSQIIHQLKKMGCSCDWTRERFTMDEGYARAVRRMFVTLYADGLIYRGTRLINWCPRCHTALSDIEVEHEDREAKLWYVRYPVKDEEGRFIEVATVRPESMLGDTAVAVNPKDKRYRDLVGKTAILPLVGRELEIIADDYVDMEFGTGAVKITPAHDPNDYEMAERHGLELINILTPDGHINENGGAYAGLERDEARHKIAADLEAQGYLVKTEDYQHSVGICYRCNTVVEPYLSEQWFVDMKPLAAPAIEAVAGGVPEGAPPRVRFVPERWTRLYLEWMGSIRDWCVSRQIWWGHQIPAWYCACGETIVAEETPATCPKCGSSELVQDPDVLDTWFSSALWPFATLGWPDETADLEYFYPTSVLSTARDILYLWVARMIMCGLRFRGDVPFDTVLIHQTVLNLEGRRMSKSLGTGVDPLDLMEKYGADGMRYGLMLQATQSQDMRFAEDKLESSRNFANKIWNAARLVLGGLDEEGPRGLALESRVGANRTLADKWLFSRLARTVADVNTAIDCCEFGEATRRLYDFFWGDYCDWYLEWQKPALRGERGAEARGEAQADLVFALDVALRLLHPFMPFITEDLWQRLPLARGEGQPESLMVAAWPTADEFAMCVDLDAEAEFATLKDVVGAVRSIRSQFTIPPSAKVDVLLRGWDEALQKVESHEADAKALAGAAALARQAPGPRPHGSAYAVVGDIEVFVPLEGLVDFEKECARLGKALEDARKELAQVDGKLGNAAFVKKAPAEVVEKERAKREEIAERVRKLQGQLEELE
jgi:valyl-tRNA synthetase